MNAEFRDIYTVKSTAVKMVNSVLRTYC